MFSPEEVEKIKKRLDRDGYYHVRRPVELDDFYHLCEQLGSIDKTSNVNVEASKEDEAKTGLKPLVKTSAPLYYHMDDLGIDYLCWWGKKESQEYEPTLYISMEDVAPLLKPETIEVFKKEKLYGVRELYYSKDEEVPLFKDGKFYVASFVKLNELAQKDPKIKAAVDDMYHTIGRCEAVANEFFLGQNEVFILDNTRFVHGRKGLNPNSVRVLHRAWVRKSA